MKVSDYIFDFLEKNNVDTIFSVSGGAAAHLLNSTRGRKIKFVCNYHEQACAMAAEGYARVSGKPACVLVTNGPGSSNTITGVLGAFQDSIPIIFISGQVPTNQLLRTNDNLQLRQLGVQECDIIDMVKSITKYAVQITNKDDVEYHLKMAFNKATTGRMGPVWLDIPLDIQSSEIEVKNLTIDEEVKNYTYNLDNVLELINNSERPLIIIGNGIHLSKSEEIFLKLKDKLQIPVIATWTSKDVMNNDDNLYVGNFGLLGERAANFAVQNSDLLLILGSRLSIPNVGYQSQMFSPKSKKVMVDIDDNEMRKSTLRIDIPIKSDLKVFINDFINLLKQRKLNTWDKWINKTQKWKKDYPVFQKEYSEIKDRINSFYFMEVLSKYLKDNSVVVTDMGTSYTCTMQSLKLNGSPRLFTSSSCCSMGFGLPGAIGAFYGSKNKEIILIAGDGGFQMNIQELQTIIHNKIPIKIFILNNNGYLAISLMQDNLFNSNYVGANNESGVSSPDFIKVGNAYGIKSVRLHNNKELNNNINDVLNYDGSIICEIMMIENQLLIPRVQSTKTKEGKIISTSLENMFPYLSDEEMKSIME